MNIYLIVGGAFAVYMILVWLLGSLLGLSGADLWILRAGLALIGLAAAGVYLWYRWKSMAARAPSSGKRDTGASESDLLLREAASRRQRPSMACHRPQPSHS